MSQKDEELKTAKDLAVKAEAELKDISQKHSQVSRQRRRGGGGARLDRGPSLKPGAGAAAGGAHAAGDEAASGDGPVC